MKLAKPTLRSNLRKIRQDFVLNNKNCQALFDARTAILEPFIASASIIGGYWAFGSEVDPSAIFDRAWSLGKLVALPYLGDGSDEMSFKLWHPGQLLEKTSFGFAQPLSEARSISPDLILVPLVGFDRLMNRLGQGAGYYDRYFSSNINDLKIGIAWSCQEVEHIPADDWDIQLDSVITEKAWISDAKSAIVR